MKSIRKLTLLPGVFFGVIIGIYFRIFDFGNVISLISAVICGCIFSYVIFLYKNLSKKVSD